MSQPPLLDPSRDPQVNHNGEGTALPDLPPVEPPSAGFVVQLFVIPALVVLVVIVVWLLFGKLAHGERDAMEYVRQLRSPKANWRMAHELASLINNDPKLASNPVLLGELSDLLSYELDLDAKDRDAELTEFVTHALGKFQNREGRLEKGDEVDSFVPLARALGPGYDERIRVAAAVSLAEHAARSPGKLDDPKAIAALAEAASSSASEPDLRRVAVYALGFFGGNTSSLLRERVASDPDRYTRYNASVALARRGDEASIPTLREMLSTSSLSKALEMDSESEKQSTIETIELQALDAILDSVASGSDALLQALQGEIEALSRSGLVSVRTRAQEILQKRQNARTN
jgi:hypothetical protein